MAQDFLKTFKILVISVVVFGLTIFFLFPKMINKSRIMIDEEFNVPPQNQFALPFSSSRPCLNMQAAQAVRQPGSQAA